MYNMILKEDEEYMKFNDYKASCWIINHTAILAPPGTWIRIQSSLVDTEWIMSLPKEWLKGYLNITLL